jgi:ribA/ribD-fused uncharacterized protein
MGPRFGQVIHIERGPLLNFWGAEIEMPHPHADGETLIYPTNEHRFQACKTLAIKDPSAVDSRRVHEAIAALASPRAAKAASRRLPISIARWNEMSFNIMLETNIAKFTQHEGLLGELLATGMAILVEHRPDPVWGDAMDGSGRNLQGVVLMYVRSQLREVDVTSVELDLVREAKRIGIDLETRSLHELVGQAEIAALLFQSESDFDRRVRASALRILNIAGIVDDDELATATKGADT